MSIAPDHDDASLQRLNSVTDALPALVAYLTPDLRYAVVNQRYARWFGYERRDVIGKSVREVLGEAVYGVIEGHLKRALAGERVTFDAELPYTTGARFVEASYVPDVRRDGSIGGLVVMVNDVTARKHLEDELREQAVSAATLARIGRMLSSELDLQKLVQAATDAGTELTRAQFGAFFYNVLDDKGESYTLYTISGVPREAFSRFPMPRNTRIFDPTFRGTRIVRFDDVTKSNDYGKNPPYHGMPEGHLPVRSYLAVPVISGNGEVLGGLFFGHAETGVFTDREESFITTIAAQAGVAIDNSRLVAALQRERTQAVEAVRQYRFLAEIIPQLVWTSDRIGALDYVNQRWIDYTGFDLLRSRQDGWRGVLHPDDADRTSLAWAQALSTGTLYEAIARIRRGADGAFRWFLARAFPLVAEDGTIQQWFGTCTDIHDQKRHEDSERLLSEVGRVLADSLVVDRALETVSSMIAAWFHGYCIIDLLGEGGLRRTAVAHVDPERGPAMNALRAFSPGEDRENALWRVLLSRRTEVCNQVTDEHLRQGAQSETHELLRRQLGTTAYVIAPLVAGGQAVGTLMLASTTGEPFDEDDVRPAEELAYRIAIAVTNARAYAQVQEANRLKDEFLAVVSHELRTPLNAMRGWMSLLRSDKLPQDQRGRALEVIERNITAQTQLVDDLLDISRIVSGRMRLNIQWADLTAIVASAIESVAPAAEAKQIRIVPTLDLSVGQIRGDTDRLQQVIWNLLSNAIKFTPRGGRVMVSVRSVGTTIELAVADTGPGISPEFLPHVFDRFRQGDSAATRPFGGLGLGLAIVRHLVELHGGTVTAASEGEGRGATFVVALPKAGEH